MQVKATYRPARKRWVVNTTAKGVKKLADGKGEVKFFKQREDAEDYAKRINDAQGTGGAITSATSGTIDAAIHRLVEKTDRRFVDGKITFSHASHLKGDAWSWSDLDYGNVRFGDVKCSEVSTADIEDDLIVQFDLSKKTIRAKLNALKQVFDVAHRRGWVSHNNPTKGVKIEEARYSNREEKKGLTRFDVAEIRTVIEKAFELDRVAPGTNINWCDGLALSFSAQTGLRFSETAALHWSDFDFEAGRVFVSKSVRKVGDKLYEIQEVGKTEAARRIVFLTPQLINDLKLWKLRAPKNELVFPTRAGTFHTSSANWYRRVLHPACDAAGIDRLRWHDLRHFYASVCLEIYGSDWNTITKLLGHTSIKTTIDLYGHWIDDPERDRINAAKLDERLWQNHEDKLSAVA